MSAESVLSSAIEVAIGIAGFAGIVAAIRQRDPSLWGPVHRLQLQMLLGASAAAILFGFLPGVLRESSLEPPVLWRVGSGLQSVWIAGIALFRTRQARSYSVSAVSDVAGWPTSLWMSSIGALQLLNLVLGEAWPYLVGVIGILVNGFVFFLRLLLGGSSRAGEAP